MGAARTHLAVVAGRRGGNASDEGGDEASGKGGDVAREIDVHGSNEEEDSVSQLIDIGCARRLVNHVFNIYLQRNNTMKI